MLIRIAGHGFNNPHLIDKLIIIKGLPFDWIFKKVPQGNQLLPPWNPDIEENIPESLKTQVEPIVYCQWFDSVRHHDRNYEGFWDTRTVHGLKLECQYGPAQEMWKKIEEYVEGTLPRTEKMPVPVLVAPDQKSDFKPHVAKRDGQGHLVLMPASVPVVDLTIYGKPDSIVERPKIAPEIPPVPWNPLAYACEFCEQEFMEKNALKNHKIELHPVKRAYKKREKATV